MTLSNGRQYLAIPGPSVIPDAVLQAMHRPAPNIYEGGLVDLAGSLVPDLKAVARTKHHVAMYISNGHGVWEAALANTLQAGETVLVPAFGRFGFGWAEMANGLGVETQIIDHGRSAPIDPERVRAALLQDKGQKVKAILAVHVDTSTSIRSDIAALRKVLDEVGHPALLMADCIASLGCDRFEMDAWGVDVMVTGSQKGLMTPPGMGFVFFNDKAAQVRDALPYMSRYWDWAPRANPELFFEYWDGTAPTHHLFGLRAALDILKAEGIEAIWARHETLATAIWAACEAWGAGGPLTLNVQDRALRSHAVTALGLGAPYGTQLRKWCEGQAGLTLGIGLGMANEDDPEGDGYFRLGHMGHVNAHMIMGLLGTLETGFRALDLPFGEGGLASASDVLAQATRG